MFISSRRDVLKGLGAAGGAMALPQVAHAQGYPERPVSLIIPFSIGGTTDVTARVFASALQQVMGQPFVPDNRAGAGGALGGGVVAAARPDGYTLLWGGTSTLAVAPALYSNLPYHPTRSFAPISRVLTTPLVLTVNSKVPAHSVAELIAFAKAKPGTLNYGSGGVGSIHHLTAELFKYETKVDIVHIPYKGNGQAGADLMGGFIHLMFMGLAQLLPLMNEKSLRPLAVSSPTRDPSIPDIPTMAEAGVANFDAAQSWFGLLAPTGTPGFIVDKLNLALREASKFETVKKTATVAGMQVFNEPPDGFAKAIVEHGTKWRAVVEAAKIRV